MFNDNGRGPEPHPAITNSNGTGSAGRDELRVLFFTYRDSMNDGSSEEDLRTIGYADGICPNCCGPAAWGDEHENPACRPRSGEICSTSVMIAALLEWSQPRRSAPAGEGATLGAIPIYPGEALPTAGRRLVEDAAKAGLPAALVGGAALAAMAAAIGGNAHLEVLSSWSERAILWVPLMAPRGAGKSPAQELAFGPLRKHDADAGDDGRILLDDMTLEALARELCTMGGAGAFDLDELSVLLRGLGEYEGSRSGDRGRFLKLWTGTPWGFKRVGTGKATNAVRLHVDQPTVGVCGGLQPHLHDLLGPDDDGMRPRWLPHLAGMPGPMGLVNVGVERLGHAHRPNPRPSAARSALGS